MSWEGVRESTRLCDCVREREREREAVCEIERRGASPRLCHTGVSREEIMASLLRCWLAVVAVGVCGMQAALGADHAVGGAQGWNPGVDYATWASSNTFQTGDTLTFTYTQGFHSVMQVSQADYTACSTSNAISSDASGSTSVKLEKEQTYYFICGTPGHCSGQGMKLSAKVVSSSSSTSTPSASTPPSTTPSTTPSSVSPSSNNDTTPDGSLASSLNHPFMTPLISTLATIYVFLISTFL